MIKFTKIIAIKNIKNTKPTRLNLMIFMLKRKMLLKDMINRNLDITVKIVSKLKDSFQYFTSVFRVDAYGAKLPPLLHFIKKYKVP